MPGSSKLFSAGHDRLYEEPLQSEDDKMIDKLYAIDTGNKSSDRLPETESPKELRKPEPYPLPEITKSLNLVLENRITLNGSPGILESRELSTDSMPFSKCNVLPTQLQQNRLCSQMEDKSPQEVSSILSSGESAVPFSGGSLRDMESAQLCDFIQNTLQDLCEGRESLQCKDNVQHNTVALGDRRCTEGNQHRDLSLSCDLIEDRQLASFESAGLPVPEQDKKSDWILSKTSLKSVSPHHVEAAFVEHTNDDPVEALEPEFSKVLHLKENSCGMPSISNSLHESQPTSLSGNDSVDVCEPHCTMASVMKDCSIEEITAVPLKVCPLSTSLQPKEDIEKIHIEAAPPCPTVGDIQPELALDLDSSLNLPGRSCTTDAVVNYSCVSPEKAPLPEGDLLDPDDIVGGCQQSSTAMATPPALVQAVVSECQSQEKSLRDVPCTSLSIPTDKKRPSEESADIVIPDTLLPDQLDLIYHCQKSVCDRATPPDSMQVTRCVHDNCSLMEVCNTVCPVSEKDDSSTEQEMTPLPDNPLIGTKTNQDSVEPCGMSTPLRNMQAGFPNKDNSIMEVSGSSCSITSAMDDDDNAKILAPLLDSQIENSESTPTSCTQAEGVVEKEARPLNDTIVAVEDFSNRNQADAPLSDSAESNTSIKKTSFENTVLPDLLLDIQPEHRMEEQLSAVPSPCDADLMGTISADCKQNEGQLLQVRLDKLCVQEAEINKMEITDPDISDDKLQNSINLSDSLSSEGTLNNVSTESGPFDLSVNNMEQSQSEERLEARTYDNSQRLLQWKNRKSLCWLDCILSALVQSKTLGVFVAKHGRPIESKDSIILNLFIKYHQATALCRGVIKKNKAGRPTKSEACLHEVRMHIFDTIKPLLKCELGNNESPVFAFPLLLRLDPDFQKLFEHTFTWKFKCEFCGYIYQERCQKTMTTFTKIFQNWQPLNAVHKSPCNKCQAVDQRREMQLETLQSMFMLHFVEGLPSNELNSYAFQFGEHRYDVRTVVRYRDQHFSTWMANDDDTWLESDDLKGSFCRRHQKLRVRAEDIHIVIWERSNGKNIQEESPPLSSTMHVSDIQSENQTSIPTAEIGPSDPSRDSPLVAPEDEVGKLGSTKYLPQVTLASECILSKPSTEHPPQLAPVADTNLPVLPSIVPVSGSVTNNISNPLAGMEGFADDDIITLTLVEIPFNSVGHPADPKPVNPSVTQVKVSPDFVLKPAADEMQNDSGNSPQRTDQKQSKHSFSEPSRSDAAPPPVCTIPQNPAQRCHQRMQNSNMPATGVATSTPNSKTFSTKKSIVDNMMGTLVKKDNFFINSSLSGANRNPKTSKLWQSATLLKESDFTGAPKKAESFDGFRAKTVNIDKSDGSSLLLSKLYNSSSFDVPKEKTVPSAKSFLAPAALSHTKPVRNGSYGKPLAKDGGLSGEDKVRRMRLKLLKKLKAKKGELAMLEKMAKLQQNGSCAGESDGVLPGSVNRRDHLRGFLQELQDHIDNADNESIGTASSCTSICSSPGDAEFFAELFSPSPVNNSGNDSRFLEMLADGYGISADHSQQATGLDYPKNSTTAQSTSGASCLPNTFNQSSSGEESLNLLSSSTLAVLNEDTGYLDSFVDIF